MACNLDSGKLRAILTNANSRKVVKTMRYAETQHELINRVKLALDVDSYNKMGKILGVPYQTLARADKNQHFFTDYYITLLCDVTGLNPMKTLACIRKEEAKEKGNTEKVKFWEKHVNAA